MRRGKPCAMTWTLAQYSALHHSAAPYSAFMYSIVQYNVMHFSAELQKIPHTGDTESVN